MTLRRLFLEADLAGIRPLQWEGLGSGRVRCSFNGDPDFSGVGPDGRAALSHLLKRLKVIR